MTTSVLFHNEIESLVPAGYVMRPATFDDLENAVALFNAYSRQWLGIDEFIPENYRVEWQSPGLNLETDVRLVIAPNGQLVGCMEVWDLTDPHVRVGTWGRVHPDHQGRGIASALLAWAETRARQAIAKAPEGARVTMLNHILDTDTAAHAALRQAGLSQVRYSWRMAIDLAEPPPAPEWPDGVRVRTLVVGQDERAVVQAVRDSFRDHWGFVERPFEDDLRMWTHWMNDDPDFDPALWFLALDGDALAGVALCWPKIQEDADMGWVGTLGVRREWRRKGLGLALLRHSFGEFYRRGKTRAGLGVDAGSLTGATRLYERAGMYVARQSSLYEKELRPGVELSTQSVGL